MNNKLFYFLRHLIQIKVFLWWLSKLMTNYFKLIAEIFFFNWLCQMSFLFIITSKYKIVSLLLSSKKFTVDKQCIMKYWTGTLSLRMYMIIFKDHRNKHLDISDFDIFDYYSKKYNKRLSKIKDENNFLTSHLRTQINQMKRDDDIVLWYLSTCTKCHI